MIFPGDAYVPGIARLHFSVSISRRCDRTLHVTTQPETQRMTFSGVLFVAMGMIDRDRRDRLVTNAVRIALRQPKYLVELLAMITYVIVKFCLANLSGTLLARLDDLFPSFKGATQPTNPLPSTAVGPLR